MRSSRHNQATGTFRRAMAPFAVFAFLLAQLLVGFHQHTDGPLNRTDGDLPQAECTLCIAAHLPFDIAPALSFTTLTSVETGNRATVEASVKATTPHALHQPRAPPAHSQTLI